MKKIIVLAFAFLICGSSSFAQPGKKPPQKDKPPTQKEMADLMKEMQKELDGMSPEDKKMMDSMGVKIPDTKSIKKNVSGISDAQLKEAYEDETRIVPKRDAARIAAIPKAVTDSKMGVYIAAIQDKLASTFKPAVVSTGNKVYDYIKSNSKNSGEAGNMAMALWLAGKPEIALYVLGKLCAIDAGNTDNLSNYSAMLSMQGAQHLAIPILNNLNAKYPKNSTLLNNLGQAWFGLGEIGKAEKYLDSTIRIYAYHPQANLTKSLIEESKGNKTEAINLVKKSIRHSYSKEKEERLNKLGYQLTSKDVTLPPKTKADPLNLGGFAAPPFPKSVDECIAMESVWETYRQELHEQAAALGKRLEEALQVAMDMQQKRNNADIVMVKASINAGSPQGVLTLVPIHASAAYLKQNEVKEEYTRRMKEFSKKTTAFFSGTAVQLKKDYDATMEKLREEDLEQTGEGLPNKDFCPLYKEISDKYLNAYNGTVETFFKEYLEIQKKYLNETTHWQMYSEWPEKFEAYKLQAQIAWLGALSAEATASFISITEYKCAKPEPGKSGKLAAFDDIACPYNDTMDLKIITFYSNCSRMTSKLNLKFFEYTRFDDFERAEGDTYMRSTWKLSVEKGFDKLKWDKGPLKVEAKIGASIEFELDRGGLKNVTLGVEAKLGAGYNTHDKGLEEGGSIGGKDVIDTTVEIGMEGRASLVSGHVTIGGTGKLERIKIIEL